MRTLTTAMQDGVDAAVTLPGFFIEILFSSPLRVSTRGEMDWNGSTWVELGAQVTGLSEDGTQSSQSASASFEDDDQTMSALVLGEGVAGRSVRIWKFYGDSPDAADPVQRFDGVCDTASGDPESGRVSISFVQPADKVLYSPRRRVTREQGFSVLPPKGTLIRWGGQQFKLEGDSA